MPRKKFTAYEIFVDQMKDQILRESGKPNLGRNELFQLAGKYWEHVSVDERARYKEIAKIRTSGIGDEKKIADTGETIASVKQRIVEQQFKAVAMREHVKKLCHEDGVARNFIFMKFRYSVEELVVSGSSKTPEHVFWPSEMSMAVFNLTHGFQSKARYSTLIDTGKYPDGYASLALESQEYTGIPLPGNKLFEPRHRDYGKILGNIKSFIEYWLKDDLYRKIGFCVFGHTKNEEINITKSCMDWLVRHHGGSKKREFEDFFSNLKYYELPKLVLYLAVEAECYNPLFKEPAVQSRNEGLVNQVLSSSRYDRRPEITCSFHVGKDNKRNKCCTNVVLKRIALMYDYFLEAFHGKRGYCHSIESVRNPNPPDEATFHEADGETQALLTEEPTVPEQELNEPCYDTFSFDRLRISTDQIIASDFMTLEESLQMPRNKR